MERRERKSPFIHLNDTARPGINCGPFHAMSYYIGCPYRCDYCYLQGTFRGKVTPVVYTNREKALAELDAWLEQPGHLRLNAGELEDSLAMDGHVPLVDDMVPRFAAQERHKLLLVTKSENVDNLLKHDPRGQVIVAFSINHPSIARQYEKGAPDPLDRLRAAARVQSAGYYVTLRLDPMIPVESWHSLYLEIVDRAYERLRPDQWTLGSLRWYPNLPRWVGAVGRDAGLFDYPRERCPEDGRYRLAETLRGQLYHVAMNRIRHWDGEAKVFLCKETGRMHRLLGLPLNGCCYAQSGNGACP